MKRLIFGLFISASLFSACKKEEAAKPTPTPTPTPAGSKSYVRLTISDKTIEARDTIVRNLAAVDFHPMLMKYSVSTNVWNPETFDKTFSFNSICSGIFYNGKMKIVISAMNYSSKNNSQIDTFKTVNTSTVAYSVEDFSGDTKKTYKINTFSKIIVLTNNDEYTEGKLDLSLKAEDGTDLPAKGEFKIYK